MKKYPVRMTLKELKSLYPDIKLMEGYDEAFVGIVPAPQSGCIAVYDSTKIIDILSASGFTTQKNLVDHFEKIVSSAQIKDGASKIGPLFMQAVFLRNEDDDTITTEDFEEHRAGVEKDKREDENAEWHVDYGLEGEKGKEGEQGDSTSSSELYDMGNITFKGSDDDDDDEDDEDLDEDNDLSDSGYDSEPKAPYMEIVVEIGFNSPKDCMITRDAKDIKEAMRLIFPRLPRLDMISKANFIFRELSDLDDDEDDDDDDEFPYMPPRSL